jgi:arylsulfatase A-like enzyme
MRPCRPSRLVATAAAIFALGCARSVEHPSTRAVSPKPRVILLVWDGLRPDSITPDVTPELARLRDAAVDFRNHHAVYPTFTMMNAAAFATGVRSGIHGFYGNTLYLPGPTGRDAAGETIDFARPVFTEDWGVLRALDVYARARGTSLLRARTLVQAAHAQGKRTAVLGKSGPAFLQDYRYDGEGSIVLDENLALPYEFARALQHARLPLPANTVHFEYPQAEITLAADNGDPTATTEPSLITLADGITPDPRATIPSPYNANSSYVLRVFLEFVLPNLDPDLSVVWLRNPDSSQHMYGPDSPVAIDSLRHQDRLLGELLRAIERLGRAQFTDLLIASDHGHSTVASSPAVFPPRHLAGSADGHGSIGDPASPGFAVSGEIRSADLLHRAGFAHVYDGYGCLLDPRLGGILPSGQPLYPIAQAASCEGEPHHSTLGFDLPNRGPLPDDAIVVAANGGSEYFYVPNQDPALVRKLVRALQQRTQYGAVFVRNAYGSIPGTMPLARIGMEGPDSESPPTPDVVASFAWDDAPLASANSRAPGTEHSSALLGRGMHGAFSPHDVRATLIAAGPSFRTGYRNSHPSSTLDVARTIASILHLDLPRAEGRVLDEAFRGSATNYRIEPFVEESEAVELEPCALDDLDCTRPSATVRYRSTLYGQTLTPWSGGARHEYFDRATVSRTPR